MNSFPLNDEKQSIPFDVWHIVYGQWAMPIISDIHHNNVNEIEEAERNTNENANPNNNNWKIPWQFAAKHILCIVHVSFSSMCPGPKTIFRILLLFKRLEQENDGSW